MARGKNWFLKPLRIEGDRAYVPLSRGLEAIIDAADAELVGAHNWVARPASKDFYAVTTIREGGKAKQWTMQNFLMRPPQGKRVDHRRASTLDNRRSELRVVTHAQNMQNRGWFRNNSSGAKGVRPSAGRWRAGITANGVFHYLGTFATKDEAAAAYRDAALRLHGEFAPAEDRVTPP
jgi:hypothetical protein